MDTATDNSYFMFLTLLCTTAFAQTTSGTINGIRYKATCNRYNHACESTLTSGRSTTLVITGSATAKCGSRTTSVPIHTSVENRTSAAITVNPPQDSCSTFVNAKVLFAVNKSTACTLSPKN